MSKISFIMVLLYSDGPRYTPSVGETDRQVPPPFLSYVSISVLLVRVVTGTIYEDT